MNKIETLKQEIREYESILSEKGVPADEKDAAMDEIKALKKEIETIQAKEDAIEDMRAEKKKKARKMVGGPKTKMVKRKAKAFLRSKIQDPGSRKRRPSGISAIKGANAPNGTKKRANMISVSSSVKKFNSGRATSDIVRDKQRRADAPGKRTSGDGNTYYEKRPNRSDVSKKDRLEKGGSLYKDGGKVSKFAKVMREFKAGSLRSGSGELVTDKRQALAIAFAESRKEKQLSS